MSPSIEHGAARPGRGGGRAARAAAALALLAAVALGAALLGDVRAVAGVLPDDRADVLFHSYEGGGITVHGPSVLVQKKFAKQFSAPANYYVDNKELSTFTSQTLRLGLSYDILKGGWRFVDKGSQNLRYDHINYDYADFRDLRATGAAAGQEPLFGYDANVIQMFVSFWF